MLCHQLSTEDVDASQVAAGPGKAGDKTKPDRIFGDGEDDGDRRRRLLRRRSGIGDGYNHADRPADQFRRQLRQPINRFFRPAVDDRCVLTLDIADRFQTIAECAQAIRNRVGRSDPQKPDDGHRRLLRARRERPRRSAADQRDEIAAFDLPAHSITSSARNMIDGGICTPRAFAVARLITNSNLLGWSTGSSDGLAPFKSLPTYPPAKR